MPGARRETWFLVAAGVLLVVVGFADLLLLGGGILSLSEKIIEAAFTIAAGVLFLIGSQLFMKRNSIRGPILLVLTVTIAVFPSIIKNEATFRVWIAVCLIMFAFAVYQSFRPHRT